MKVFIGQIYIEPGISFGFSCKFQAYLGSQISELVESSSEFIMRYGVEYELVFHMSAKQQLVENEIRGPTVYKKDKDIEYTIFLPFDLIQSSLNVPKTTLMYLFSGMITVLDSLSVDSSRLAENKDAIIENICSDESMLSEQVVP